MEKQYRRVNDIDEKIKNVSLPYFHWKVLFLVLEETSIDELVSTLNSDESTVKQALESLEKNGILEVSSTAEAIEEQIEEKITDTEEEESTEIFEVEEPEPVEEQKEEVIEESEPEEEQEVSKEDEPIAELLDESFGDSEEEAENVSVDVEESQPDEEMEEEEELSLEDTIEEEFDKNESDEISLDEEPEEAKAETETLDTETKEETEAVTEEEESSADISSFIDEIGADEESETDKKDTAVEEKPAEKAKPAPKEPSAGAKTIMVIDDSIVIRKMVEIALEDGDYKIVTSNSGKDGMNLLDEENPDLVIADMTLPDMNGIDLLKTVKAAKGIPVIMLSGKDAPQLVENAKNAGADDFLPKPFRDDDLIEKVKSLLK